jgi:uncharacterized protein
MAGLHVEVSPYVSLHASDPVKWFPWHPETFSIAKASNKPVFLSVGYSTCHFCHVMRRDAFSSPPVIDLLNNNFLCVKVDREEYPAVDRACMSFAVALQNAGGWPLNVFLTPAMVPFFATVFQTAPSFQSLLQGILSEWKTNTHQVQSDAAVSLRVLTSMRQTFENIPPLSDVQLIAASHGVIKSAYIAFLTTYDEANGGFGGMPKFPRPCVFNFLFRLEKRKHGAIAAKVTPGEMALRSLAKIGLSGLRDHVGGGFFRYSVDSEWCEEREGGGGLF